MTDSSAPPTEDSRYRLLVESVTDYAIYMLDVDGRVSSWNLGAQRLKGYTATEAIGQHFSCFYTTEEQAACGPARALSTAAQRGKFEGEGWRVRKDGLRFWAHVVIDPIRNAAGELLGYAKITRDLTERRAAEDSLKRSEEQESWSSLQREGIDEEILGGEARAPGTGSIRYGMAASGIGYTAIRSLDRFVESDDWSEQVSVVDSAFADLFAMMSDDDPLILDLSHNGGGWDYLARAVARQVIRERRQAYTKWVAGAPELSRQTFDLEPASKWRGHLYIVTSDLTMSAAEVIIMSLHDLPYVTLVGQTTRGAFSDRMSMLLPNGWEVQFGNEIYEAPDGEVYEGRGFEPEIPLSIFPPDDLSNGHARAVRELLERIAAPDE